MGYIRRNIVRPPTRPISVQVDSEPATTAQPHLPEQPTPTAPMESMVIETTGPVEPIINQLLPTESAYQQRNLWTDNVWRTRNFYISYMNNFPDQTAAKAFLDQNLRDLGNSVKPYYGNGAGDRLRDTLESRLMAFTSILEYVKAAPPMLDLATDPTVGQRLLVWKDRNDAVFDVLASLNPATWNKTEVRNVIDNGLDFWWNQIQSRHKNEWVRDLTFLDYSFDNAARTAGMVLRGIPS